MDILEDLSIARVECAKELLEELEDHFSDMPDLRNKILNDEKIARTELWRIKIALFEDCEKPFIQKRSRFMKSVMGNVHIATEIAGFMDMPEMVYNFSKAINAPDEWPFLADYVKKLGKFQVDTSQIAWKLFDVWFASRGRWITELSRVRLRSFSKIKSYPWPVTTHLSLWNAICSWVEKKGIPWFETYMELSPVALYEDEKFEVVSGMFERSDKIGMLIEQVTLVQEAAL